MADVANQIMNDSSCDQQSVICSFQLNNLRERIAKYVDKHQYESALFWADKVFTLSNGIDDVYASACTVVSEDISDVYMYAQTLYLTGQFHRAAHLIRQRKLDKTNASCRYLAAKCYFECKEWQEALNVIDMVDGNRPNILNTNQSESFIGRCPMTDAEREMENCINLLRGRIYEAMDNRGLASDCFREALQQDIYCYEAFDLLVNHHMLSAREEQDLLQSLPFMSQCDDGDAELVKFIYTNRLKKYDKPSSVDIPKSLSAIGCNLDIRVSVAERHYYNCDFRQCHDITSKILRQDLYNAVCLPLHIAVLVELGKTNELFYLAHKLVDLYPNKPVSWFAVGCYYYYISDYEPARRYFSKATTLDRVYGPAWLAFGHSFAAANEHDQAMAAYFTASQLMKGSVIHGCHLPVLYIGLEYGLTNNSRLADQFFNQALSIAPDDPFVLHEMGVIAFQNYDWTTAERYFSDALTRVQYMGQLTLPEKWEPLLNNLGHTSRKHKKYNEALDYHRQALSLCPQNPSTFAAIGYVYVLKGDNLQAVDYFHKALSIRRDDAFSTTMLGNIMESLMSDLSPTDEVLPVYTAKSKLDVSRSIHDEEDDRDTSLVDTSVADVSSIIMEVEMEGSD